MESKASLLFVAELEHAVIYNNTTLGKLAWPARRSTFRIGDTSSNGRFSIAMLVFRGII